MKVPVFMLLMVLSLTLQAVQPLAAMPGWPGLPSDAKISGAAQAFTEKGHSRIPVPTMPGNPPDGSYTETIYRVKSQIKMHNPAVSDPVEASEAFVIFECKSQIVHPDGPGMGQTNLSVARLVWKDPPGEFIFEDVSAWGMPQKDTELFPWLASFLNGWYSKFLDNERSSTDQWLPGFKTAGTAVEIKGFDGTDHVTPPLSFHIRVHSAGAPVPGAKLTFRVVEGVKGLGDHLNFWDPGLKQWQSLVVNLALDRDIPAQLDPEGNLRIRLFTDFERMRRLQLSLPHTVTVQVQVETPAGEKRIEKCPVKLHHPAFIRDVFFWCRNDPQFNPPRWIRIHLLDTLYSHLQTEYYGQIGKKLEPLQAGGLKVDRFVQGGNYPYAMDLLQDRVMVGWKTFSPPLKEGPYWAPVENGDVLTIHTGVVNNSSIILQPGDGIMVHVEWADGVYATFSQIRKADDQALAARLGPGWGGSGLSREEGFIRFVVNQAGENIVVDRIIRWGATAGATALAGPVAGAWTYAVVSGIQNVKDIFQTGQFAGSEHKMVVVRSTLALEQGENGESVLHCLEGNPEIRDAAGQTVAVPVGQAAAFNSKGIQPATVRALPARLQGQLEGIQAREPQAATGAPEAPLAPAATTGTPDSPDPGARTQNPPASQVTPVKVPVVTPPVTATATDPLEAARRRYREAFTVYTELATTGGAGDIEAALREYKEAYAVFKKLEAEAKQGK